jgi:hypothetical protein
MINESKLVSDAIELEKEVQEAGMPLASQIHRVVQMIDLDGDLYELIVAIKPIANMQKYLGDS